MEQKTRELIKPKSNSLMTLTQDLYYRQNLWQNSSRKKQKQEGLNVRSEKGNTITDIIKIFKGL